MTYQTLLGSGEGELVQILVDGEFYKSLVPFNEGLKE